MYQVVKRDGKIVDFDIVKIADAIKKAFDATGTEYNDSVIDFLALSLLVMTSEQLLIGGRIQTLEWE